MSSTVLHNLVHTSSIRYFTARQVPSKHCAAVYNRNVTHTLCRSRLQVERLIRMIPLSLTNIREEVFIIFFGRLVDLRNIERPLWALTLRERQAVIHRLGFLNLCVASTIVHSPLCCALTHIVRGMSWPTGGTRCDPMAPFGLTCPLQTTGAWRQHWCTSQSQSQARTGVQHCARCRVVCAVLRGQL